MKKRIITRQGAVMGILSAVFFFSVEANLNLLNVHASEVSKQHSEEAVQNVLEDYFEDFLDTMLADSSRDYSSDDFATINGYIAAKYLAAKREGNKILLDGIQAVSLEEVVLEELLEKDDSLEATAYVKYEYSWGSGSQEDTCGAGSLYQVTLAKTDEGYKVLDLDDIENDEVQMAKDSICISAQNSKDIYQRADEYFDKIQQNAKDMTETVVDSKAIETEIEAEDENLCAPTNINVSYDTSPARNWGYQSGDQYENYIFKRAAEHYTNFASPCVWAGYGGADGYNILNSPFINDTVCAALKELTASYY